ncbi:hypothetical protein PVBG_01270 [Plasmodium vivax Brazil I]|uniref:Uncharacterized protein n=1 Tax=Plasmodium vivax (strain Brazil I) TaxID=1033975 RepID=A0A0J9SRI1_PLAV1|nr:hypothetical protein PVBG_01270 [Plasmodium vivax Brazil I]
MKGSLLIVFVALLASSFCFLVKEKSGLLGFTRGHSNWGKAAKGRSVGRKFLTSWREEPVCENGGALQEGVVPTHDRLSEPMQGGFLDQGPPKEQIHHPKRRKFLNAKKEDDYYHLYLHHICKKVKIIKKQRYLYSPTKYESVRSYIKRELKECLDMNTAAYLFKATEYYAKGVLDVSVYVSEVVHLLSFFTFNGKCNLEGDEGGSGGVGVGVGGGGDAAEEQAGGDDAAEQILKGGETNGTSGKTKMSKLLQKDERYKSFCLHFTRLVDAVSGLFCCIGKRSKREEIASYLKRSSLTDQWHNYSPDDLHLDTNFMIYIIRLTKYKDANYLCSLKRLRGYAEGEVKEIFLNCMRDGLLDLDYLTILQSAFLARESCRGDVVPRLFAPSNVSGGSGGSGVGSGSGAGGGGETQIKQEHLRKIEQRQKEEKRGKLSEDQLKSIISELLGRNVFLAKGDSDKLAKKKKKKKKKKKWLPMEEERLQEVIKKRCGGGTLGPENCANVVRRMNRLLDSHDVDVAIRLRPRGEGGLAQEEAQGGAQRDTQGDAPKTSDATEDGVTVRDIRSSRDIRNRGDVRSDGEGEERADEKVDLSDFSLSNLKKYITYRKALQERKNAEGDTAKERGIGEASGEKGGGANPGGLSQLDQDVLKYFDVTPRQDSVLFEFNDFILEKELSSARLPQGGQPVLGALPGGGEEEVVGELGEEFGEEAGEDVGEVAELVDEEAVEEVDDEVVEEMAEEVDEEDSEEIGEESGEDVGDDSGEAALGTDWTGAEPPPRGKKAKINRDGKGAAEKLRMHLRTRGSTKSRHQFENIFPRDFEEKMELLMVILKEEGKNKKKVIVCADEEERDIIRMKCTVEGVEYEEIVGGIKNIKRYMKKGGNFQSACFVLMGELASTLELRKVCGGLSERAAGGGGERSGGEPGKDKSGRSDTRDDRGVEPGKDKSGRSDTQDDRGGEPGRGDTLDDRGDVTIYHFAEHAPKALALKKLFHSIVNEEDNVTLYMKSRKRGGERTREATRATRERKSNPRGTTNHSDVFVPYQKRVRKKKLSKSEEKWLAFRRRTLKKIDEMKQKAHLIKMRKMKKRDQRVQRVVTKLKARSKEKTMAKGKSKSKSSKVGAKKR